MMKNNFIPTINISKIDLESENSKNNIIFKQIQKACIEVGFFQIVGHGIEKNLIHKITKTAHIFFNSKAIFLFKHFFYKKTIKILSIY